MLIMQQASEGSMTMPSVEKLAVEKRWTETFETALYQFLLGYR